MSTQVSWFSSILKKQIVAVTGLGLIVFVIMHLAGNLLLLAGPQMYNAYALKLQHFGYLLWFARGGLLLFFVTHIYVTYLLVLENIKARGGVNRYAVGPNMGHRSFATRLMPYTGTFLFLFILWHLYDFTFINHQGPRILINGVDYGLYGIVVNAFMNKIHSALYIVAMFCLGFHLVHGVESVVQTFGFYHPKVTPALRRFSFYMGVVIAAGFSLIPVYVLYVFAR